MAERMALHGPRPPAAMPAGRPPRASGRRRHGEREQAPMPPRATCTREVVAVLEHGEALEAALADLQSNGFDRSQISLLATRAVVERLGHSPELEALPIPSADTGGAPGALTEGALSGSTPTGAPAALAGMIAASMTAVAGGPLAGIGMTALPATAGADAVASVLARLFPAQVADHLHEQIDRGGVLVWITLPHPEREATAREILGRHAGEVRTYAVAV